MTELNENERKKIQEQAKSILDNFANALSKVKTPAKKKAKEELGGFREERKEAKTRDIEFRKIMFSNAPHTNGDNIVAETKEW